MTKNSIKTAMPTLMAILFYCFASVILLFTYIMITKVIPYLSFEYAYNFLGTKSDEVLHKPHFIVAFYIHIVSSVFVIGGGIFQFSLFLMRKYPQIHRWIGKIYVSSILLFAAPSGMVIGLYANGGLSGKVGFVLQSITWWIVTYWAWDAVMKKDYLLHTNMMLRSFALTIAAMSLRTESFAMYYFFQTKPIETYQTVTWLSWVGNLLFVEMLVYYGLGKRLLKAKI